MRSRIFTSIISFMILVMVSATAQDLPTAQNLPPVSLDCVYNINNGVIEINWSANTNDCNNFENYQVYVSPNRLSGFTLVTEINQENNTVFVDSTSANISNTLLFYYVVRNCDGETSLHSDTLDNERPKFPIIDYISVVGDNVEIKWQESESPEADAYIIHYFTDNGFVRIDTISNTNLIYTHTNAEPNLQTERYTISTIDACGDEGARNTEDAATVYLEAISTTCSNDVFLNWSPYEGWTNGVGAYELYVSYNGEAFSLVDLFEADADRYNFANNQSDVNDLCFQIKAYRADDLQESNSNTACVNLSIASGNEPDYIYFRNLTILDDGSTQVEYYIDNQVNIETIRYFSGTSVDDLNLIETQLVNNNLATLNTYNDVVSDSRNRILTYQIQAEDSCGIRYNSKYARTIHLTGKPDGANNNYLFWTGFGIDGGTVTSYNVYRKDLNGDFIEVGTTMAGMVQFNENVQFLQPDENGEICYRIEAVYDIDYPLLPTDRGLSSLSNVVCITQPGRIITPNAFAPNGVNSVFKPVTVNIDPANYQMVIMNRWGGVVFESRNFEEGWDGSYKGRDAQEGVYAYYFSYSGFDGELREKKGTVLLLR